MALFLPLFDAYAANARTEDRDDARLSPFLMNAKQIPKDVLLVVSGRDILVHEQVEFVKKVLEEIKDMGQEGNDRRIEEMYLDNAFHGFLERKHLSYPATTQSLDWGVVPNFILEKERRRVFNRAASFLSEVHRKHGFHLAER